MLCEQASNLSCFAELNEDVSAWKKRTINGALVCHATLFESLRFHVENGLTLLKAG
jgi:hypothetical protein